MNLGLLHHYPPSRMALGCSSISGSKGVPHLFRPQPWITFIRINRAIIATQDKECMYIWPRSFSINLNGRIWVNIFNVICELFNSCLILLTMSKPPARKSGSFRIILTFFFQTNFFSKTKKPVQRQWLIYWYFFFTPNPSVCLYN